MTAEIVIHVYPLTETKYAVLIVNRTTGQIIQQKVYQWPR